MCVILPFNFKELASRMNKNYTPIHFLPKLISTKDNHCRLVEYDCQFDEL